jgi:hypothetical protein
MQTTAPALVSEDIHGEPIKTTKYRELGYIQVKRGLWRLVDRQTGRHIGPRYPTESLLCADLDARAFEYDSTLERTDHYEDEERAQRRAELVRQHGFDPWIPEATAAEITAIVQQYWRVIRRRFNGANLTFEVSRRPEIPTRTILDIEGELARKYGNRPHMLAQDFMSYRLTFVQM